ncbi:uncharacterized protein LOC111702106 isoform X1 [Eurytemora carolleeae]|uniref:uncharacterized protein LOC111702106 isoform X1 n=2 Tax=Eurytemora carolleeae TaxID=1294199 RepID=UPI000C7915C2|nr:uncharacterized protein LOC111702106 isoform X1 [Eurytemora carolleeae]|eukprot:XP_023329447.1 uncharacterized protein LOC111702106 isoform X1 [Eurytemora affinis]
MSLNWNAVRPYEVQPLTQTTMENENSSVAREEGSVLNEDNFTRTTMSSSTVSASSVIIPVLLVLAFLAVLLIITVIIYCKRKRRGKDRPDIGLPSSPISTLGNQYQIKDFISSNNERKFSDKSSYSVEELEECIRKDSAYGDGVRISKYIDAVSEGDLHKKMETIERSGKPVSEKVVERENGKLLPEILLEGDEVDGDMNSTHLDTRLGFSIQYLDVLAPIAGGESNPSSRPHSVYTNTQEQGGDQPGAQPQGGEGEKKRDLYRPYSQIIESNQRNEITKKKNELQGAQSEMFLSVASPKPYSAKSESNLSSRPTGSSNLPPVPPKRTPLLPPKQAVGKSREDIDRITKEILRSSVLPTITKLEEVDEDYDLPVPGAGLRVDEKDAKNEDEDYDEPPVSFSQEDYDEPTHSFQENNTSAGSRYYFTPRKEYAEDYEEEIQPNPPALRPNPELKRTPSYQDYDEPTISHRNSD